ADKTTAARAALGKAAAIEFDTLATDSDGLAIVVVRRLADGGFEPLGGIAADDKRAGQILQAVAAGR
ncbi:MAG: hypothetical protein ABW192_08200, partial [Sphingobium sp.]